MNSVEDLDVFKLAHQLALKIYSVSKTFPREETYSLIDQMRRAAGSVGMNLMEGAMRLGSKEYRQFVGIARGSAGEVCYQLLLARDLNYISTVTYQELRTGYDRVIQMLSRLSQTLDSSITIHEHGFILYPFTLILLSVEESDSLRSHFVTLKAGRGRQAESSSNRFERSPDSIRGLNGWNGPLYRSSLETPKPNPDPRTLNLSFHRSPRFA